MTNRILGVVAVFGLGVGIGCAAAPLIVPKASAQQAATLTKWEYKCIHSAPADTLTENAQSMGVQGWEMSGLERSVTCFKRPKM